jgi:hypothetical protein
MFKEVVSVPVMDAEIFFFINTTANASPSASLGFEAIPDTFLKPLFL